MITHGKVMERVGVGEGRERLVARVRLRRGARGGQVGGGRERVTQSEQATDEKLLGRVVTTGCECAADEL
jgi:hypothetical protein